MTQVRAKYNAAFRQEAVQLAVSGDKTIAQTARNLGIKETSLYHWINKAKGDQSPLQDGEKKWSVSELVGELSRLKKENARLKEERDILKKAAIFFAKEEQRR